MNATNRVVNRTLLFLVGFLLLALGAGTVTAAVWPLAGDIWKAWSEAAVGWMVDADRLSRISESTTVSGLVLGVLALLVLIVVLAVTVLAKLGGGRTTTVIRAEAEGGAQGPITIQHGFVSEAITHSLEGREEILSARVRAARVKAREVLHVSVTPRQNTSPVEVAATVTRLVDNLVLLTGQEMPTFVSIHSGIRSRLAAEQPRVR